MKTPEEFEKIAIWMGWEKKKLSVCSWWEDVKGTDLGATENKTSLTDAGAIFGQPTIHEAVEQALLKLIAVEQSGAEWAQRCEGFDAHLHNAVEGGEE